MYICCVPFVLFTVLQEQYYFYIATHVRQCFIFDEREEIRTKILFFPSRTHTFFKEMIGPGWQMALQL